MKRAIIAHCWGGYPEYTWYPWTKKELEARGFQVTVPAFPHTHQPTQADWIPYLAEQIGTPDNELFLIGHSVGCITILRYLETLSEGETIGGAVLVAGFTDAIGFEELKNYFETPIDFEKIASKSKRGFIAIHSDNDPHVDLKFADVFKEKLHAEVVVKHAMGHFSGEDNCTELPDVIVAIEKLEKN